MLESVAQRILRFTVLICGTTEAPRHAGGHADRRPSLAGWFGGGGGSPTGKVMLIFSSDLASEQKQPGAGGMTKCGKSDK